MIARLDFTLEIISFSYGENIVLEDSCQHDISERAMKKSTVPA